MPLGFLASTRMEIGRMQTITDEQFLEEFKKACRVYFDEYMQQDDPDDPVKLFYSIDLEMDIIKKHMDAVYADFADRVWRLDRELSWAIDNIMRSFQKEVQSWFNTVGYDYKNIPPAPQMDHSRRKMKKAELEAWKSRTNHWSVDERIKTAYQIGQLVYIGSSNNYSGWAKLFTETGMLIAHFYSPYRGIGVWSKDLTQKVWDAAEELSKLTVWEPEKFRANPKKINRAIRVEFEKIIDKHGLQKYFHVS
jgi:hypothetical protein